MLLCLQLSRATCWTRCSGRAWTWVWPACSASPRSSCARSRPRSPSTSPATFCYSVRSQFCSHVQVYSQVYLLYYILVYTIQSCNDVSDCCKLFKLIEFRKVFVLFLHMIISMPFTVPTIALSGWCFFLRMLPLFACSRKKTIYYGEVENQTSRILKNFIRIKSSRASNYKNRNFKKSRYNFNF